MLLTRKATSQAAAQPRLSRGRSSIAMKTMDRRAFLKRSGLTVRRRRRRVAAAVLGR